MKIIQCGLVVVSMVLLSACTTVAKTTKSFDQMGQFSHYPLNTHTYRISLQVPQHISYATAQEMTLLKSAQITVQQQYQYFKVLQDPSYSNQAPRQAVVYNTPHYYSPFYHPFYYDPFFNTPQIVQIDPVQVSYHIEMYKENQQPKEAFDARLILQSLGQKYGVSATGETLIPAVEHTKK